MAFGEPERPASSNPGLAGAPQDTNPDSHNNLPMQLITLDFFAEHLGPQLPTINLLDVGAAGGIDASWRVFGARLNALGVDPLVAEVKRLNAEEASENIKYYAAFVE